MRNIYVIVVLVMGCSSGQQGPQGIQGEKGAPGEPGTTGATGPQGPAGATGPAGPQGPVGAQGAPGSTGSIGPQGPIGMQGPQGIQGPSGVAGTDGPQGPAGPSLKVYSVDGGVVGGAFFVGSSAWFRVWVNNWGCFAGLNSDFSGIAQASAANLLFTGTNCTGDRYIQVADLGSTDMDCQAYPYQVNLSFPGTILRPATPLSFVSTLGIASHQSNNGGQCVNYGSVTNMSRLLRLELVTTNVTFSGPFAIGP